MKGNKRIKVYFIEYSESIKFFNIQNGLYIEMIKNEQNYKEFKKILNSNKYMFIDLLEKK